MAGADRPGVVAGGAGRLFAMAAGAAGAASTGAEQEHEHEHELEHDE